MSDFCTYQQQANMKLLVLTQAGFERSGSKFIMTRRLLRLKGASEPRVHERRFKVAFTKTAMETNLRQSVANAIQQKLF